MTERQSDINRRILVIDDNHAIHEDFKKILCGDAAGEQLAVTEELLFGDEHGSAPSHHFELDYADQGKKGLALVQQACEAHRPFAVAFVDMRMPPGWDGVETIEQLWKADPELQVVICTAYSDHDWAEMTQRLGHSEKLLILRKPFDLIEVQQLADSLTHKWNVERKAKLHVASLVQSEHALKRALAETESFVKAISSILIGLNGHNHIVRWNETAEQTFGVSHATVVDRPLQAARIQWDWDFFMIAVQDCRRQEKPLRIPELRFLDPLGKERFLELTLSPILGEFDASSGVLILGKDITRQKSRDAQLVTAQKMESIGQLAAGVAHEINTPVHYVAENIRFLTQSFHDLRRLLDSYETLMERTQDEKENRETMDVVRKIIEEVDLEYLLNEIPTVLIQSLEGTDRVAEIIRAMNEFSHPRSEEKTAIDLSYSLQNAMTLSSNEWKDVAEVLTDFAGDLPPIPGSPTQLTQVWLNLIVNAAQAIKGVGFSKKGLITITTQLDNEWVEVRVSDTGTGIPESIQSQVFDLFFTTKDVGEGTGQGLALAHSIIVNNHGGHLTFESRPMGGTTFVVRLPLEPAGIEVSGVNG